MKFAIIAARVIVGLIFFVFGLNRLFHLIPTPEFNEPRGDYLSGLDETGYFMVVVMIVETLSGLMILTGRFLPLGLILLAPVSVNIFLAHLFLGQPGLALDIVIISLQLFLAWGYRGNYAGVLQANAQPTGQV